MPQNNPFPPQQAANQNTQINQPTTLANDVKDKIFEALINAQKRGVKIRGVVDMNNDMTNPYKDTFKLIEQLKTVKTDYKKLADYLENNGIPVFSPRSNMFLWGSMP